MDLSVVKFGGSAITMKEKPFKLKRRALRSLCSQVVDYVKKGGRVIIVHGGGSFGHPLALKYKLNKGLNNEESYVGVSLTRLAMRKLNQEVVKEFVRLGAYPYTVEPSSSFILEDNEVRGCYIDCIEVALRKGFIPILHGDIILNKGVRGISILSGDSIASMLAMHFKASKLIYVLDVNGIYLEDPKVDPKARVIRFLNEKLLERIKVSSTIDATGGLIRKIEEGLKAFNSGVKTVCFIGWRGRNLLKALEGTRFRGTLIKR